MTKLFLIIPGAMLLITVFLLLAAGISLFLEKRRFSKKINEIVHDLKDSKNLDEKEIRSILIKAAWFGEREIYWDCFSDFATLAYETEKKEERFRTIIFRNERKKVKTHNIATLNIHYKPVYIIKVKTKDCIFEEWIIVPRV